MVGTVVGGTVVGGTVVGGTVVGGTVGVVVGLVGFSVGFTVGSVGLSVGFTVGSVGLAVGLVCVLFVLPLVVVVGFVPSVFSSALPKERYLPKQRQVQTRVTAVATYSSPVMASKALCLRLL